MHKFDEMSEPELKAYFNELSAILQGLLPENTGFVLLTTDFKDQNAPWQYASNARREDIKTAFHEILDRWDEPGHDIPR